MGSLSEYRSKVVVLERVTTRLRGLVLEAEWADSDNAGDHMCPWCRGYEIGTQPLDTREVVGHRPDCPAFSAPGVVR